MMSRTVYTNYWVNKRNDERKEHGSYATEEEALNAIYTWWRIHRQHYESDVVRTNSGALELQYDRDDLYVYRIEKRDIEGTLPSRSYKLKSSGEIQKERLMYQLNDEELLFDELPEPYRDRLIETMADASKVRNFCYTKEGQLVLKLTDVKKARQGLSS